MILDFCWCFALGVLSLSLSLLVSVSLSLHIKTRALNICLPLPVSVSVLACIHLQLSVHQPSSLCLSACFLAQRRLSRAVMPSLREADVSEDRGQFAEKTFWLRITLSLMFLTFWFGFILRLFFTFGLSVLFSCCLLSFCFGLALRLFLLFFFLLLIV